MVRVNGICQAYKVTGSKLEEGGQGEKSKGLTGQCSASFSSEFESDAPANELSTSESLFSDGNLTMSCQHFHLSMNNFTNLSTLPQSSLSLSSLCTKVVTLSIRKEAPRPADKLSYYSHANEWKYHECRICLHNVTNYNDYILGQHPGDTLGIHLMRVE